MMIHAAPSRRLVLSLLGSALAGGVFPQALSALAATSPAAGTPFTRSTVTEMARALAKKPFEPPSSDLPDSIKNLTYDQYRAIYFRPDKAIWADEKLPFQVQLLPRGFYFKEKIEVATVDDGRAHHVAYSPDMYAPGAIVTQPLPTADIGFSGVRVHGHINSPDHLDEIIVFQGSSYFRAVGKGQVYGISSRGLALDIGAPKGEEFPIFRAFWIEKPGKDVDAIVIHALLDSASVAGAYRFSVRPGLPTVTDVEVTLFPRVALKAAGLAPGTSMFYFDGNGRENFDDWRPQVHDSDGLLIVNGGGERLWRPLANPKNLQFSAFVDSGVRGFGLMQRDRDYNDYDDYNAGYEKRPSLWVEPVGDWGKGSVVLVEIPSDSEINDNIVAYWQPAEPIAAGSEYAFAYRLSWGDGPAMPGTIVAATRRGRGALRQDSPVRRFVIDYVDTGVAVAPAVADAAKPAPAPADDPPPPLPTAQVTAGGGAISDILVERNPVSGGWRLTFNLDPKSETLIELRAVLSFADKRPVDTWLYRWTA